MGPAMQMIEQNLGSAIDVFAGVNFINAIRTHFSYESLFKAKLLG